MAEWIRSLGIEGVAPNHGWRHRFATVSRFVGMPEDVRNIIQGRAGAKVADRYGETWPLVALREIEKLPRYLVNEEAYARSWIQPDSPSKFLRSRVMCSVFWARSKCGKPRPGLDGQIEQDRQVGALGAVPVPRRDVEHISRCHLVDGWPIVRFANNCAMHMRRHGCQRSDLHAALSDGASMADPSVCTVQTFSPESWIVKL